MRYICQELAANPRTFFYATMFDEGRGVAVYSAYVLNANNVNFVAQQAPGSWTRTNGNLFTCILKSREFGPDYMSRAGPVSRAGVSLPGFRHVCQTQQKSTSRLHDNRASPVSRDPGIAVPGSRLAGLTFFHVIAFAGPARLIKPIRAQNQARSGFPRFIASAINRAGSPHIIPAESDLGTPKQPGYPGQPGSCNQALNPIIPDVISSVLNFPSNPFHGVRPSRGECYPAKVASQQTTKI